MIINKMVENRIAICTESRVVAVLVFSSALSLKPVRKIKIPGASPLA